MGFDMFTVKQGRYFRANIGGINLLLSAMRSANVDLDTESLRVCKSKYKQHGSLALCFSSNDGWLVRPEECREIAEKLSRFRGRYCTTYEISEEGLMMLRNTEDLRALDVGSMLVPETRHLSEDDLDFIEEFATYCREASKLGGFYVH